MNVTATAVAVTLAVVIGVGFLFLGPNLLRPFGAVTDEQVSEANLNMAPTSENVAPLSGPLPTTLTVVDTVEGTGAAAKSGDIVTVHYIGALPDGTVFDASARHGQPFTFQLGTRQVITGWDEGLVGMKEGGKRRLVIPPDMAYGSQGAGGVIPPNATLIFEVELVKVGQ